MKKILFFLLPAVFLVCCNSELYSQFKIDRIVSGNGGGVSSGTNFIISGTGGQTMAGRVQSASFIASGGFWYTYSALTGVNDQEMLPDKFMLYQNYPNPFNPVTRIKYQIPEEAVVSLRIYNIIGEEIAVLVNSTQPAGNYTVEWNAAGFPSGFYIYRIEAGKDVSVKKLILLK